VLAERYADAIMQAAVEAFWASFRQASGVDHDDYDVFAFGDSPQMADELAGLVLRGTKRATAGLVVEYERDNEPIPREGSYAVVLDGSGSPVCVIRTTQVKVKPLREVDGAFAWDEGEGARTVAWWLDAHRRFFIRGCAAAGVAFSDDLLTVFERFELVWPLGGGEGGRADTSAQLSQRRGRRDDTDDTASNRSGPHRLLFSEIGPAPLRS
jgi:uncharacterized protein YhfF